MAAGERGTEPPIVIGAPDFTASAATSTAISPSPGVSSNNDHASRDSMGSVGEIQANVLRSRDLNVHSLPPLPAAAAELRWIATRFDVSPLIGAQATEASLKAVRSPSIVHIATHAFFLDDVPSSERSPGSPRTKSSRKIASYENPLLRSGLFLAGASVRGDDEGEDGVLTALEVSGLDLAGTELVTLSGCDTGLGKVSNGDGVYGLRRALSLAGARSQMMSLWQVHDVATQRLMESYYGRLLRGEGRSEALRQVQLKMIEDPVFSDPYFWAPFIVAGDWKPLARSSLPQR